MDSQENRDGQKLTMNDVSKLASDHLRSLHPDLKASHARELVAACFGFKTHASLLVYRNSPWSERNNFCKMPEPPEFLGRCLDLYGLKLTTDPIYVPKQVVTFLKENCP